jgi:dTMP kinase
VILPALQRGSHVLCDRYNDSTIAYQGVARHLGVPEITALCNYATGGLVPHLTFYLDLSPELGSERIRKMARAQDRFEKEKRSFSQTVREAFLQLAQEAPDRIKILDASQPPMTVVQEALRHLEKYCGSLTVPPAK